MNTHLGPFLFFFILLFALISGGRQAVFGQEKIEEKIPRQTVRGTIIDQDSRSPIGFAKIWIAESDPFLGTLSDEEGNFHLENVPVGRITLMVSYVGYETQVLTNLMVTGARELVLSIEIREQLVQLEQVDITATNQESEPNNEMSAVSGRSFSVEDAGRIAATGNDPARIALSFAGVSTQNDLLNEIVIRGNSPAGVLWRLEGIEIPSPNHFTAPGASGGAVSIISSSLLGSSDFYTGAFAGDYGNALSGVFDLRFRKGNNEKREFGVRVGNAGVETNAEGPFAKKGGPSFLLNYRYSTLSIMDKIGYSIIEDRISSFQDLNVRLFFPTKKAGIFSLFGVAGTSTFEDPPERNPALWTKTSDRRAEILGYKMLATGISHSLAIREKGLLKTTLGFTGAYNTQLKSIINKRTQLDVTTNDLRQTDLAIRFASVYQHKIDAANTLRAGVYYNRLFYRYLDGWSRKLLDWTRNEKGWGDFIEGFVSWKHRFANRLTLVSGLHTSLFLPGNAWAIEPRLGLTWNLNERQELNFGAGMHSRMAAMPTYFAEVKDSFPNLHLPLMKAIHLVAGHKFRLLKTLSIRSELYFQYLYKVPIIGEKNPAFSMINETNSYVRAPLDPSGDGMNYGLDLTIEKHFAKNYYVLANISLYDSRFRTIEKEWLSTRYNGNFVTSLSGGKEFRFGKRKPQSIGLHARILWSGGRRIMPVDTVASQALGYEVADWEKGYSQRVANYFRIDLRTVYRIDLRKFAFEISADVQNITDRKNEYYRYFDTETGETVIQYQIGLFPYFLIKLEF